MICVVCYSNRPQAKRIPTGFPAGMGICTGCAIDMDKSLGFMALQGHGFMLNLEGKLHLIDLMTGEAWPTDFGTVAEIGQIMEHAKKYEGGTAPPTPSKEPKGTGTPDKP